MLQFSKTKLFDIISMAFICQSNLAEDSLCPCVRVLLMVAIMKLLLLRSRVAGASSGQYFFPFHNKVYVKMEAFGFLVEKNTCASVNK